MSGAVCILPNSGFWNPVANWLLELRNPESLHRGPYSIKHTPVGALLLIQGHQKHALNLPLQEHSVLNISTATLERVGSNSYHDKGMGLGVGRAARVLLFHNREDRSFSTVLYSP